MLGGTPVHTEYCYLFLSYEFFILQHTLLLCCVQMSSERGTIRVGKSKLGRGFPSSEEIETLHEHEGVLSSEGKNNEGFPTEVPERVERDRKTTEKRILVCGFLALNRNPDVDQHL